MLKVTIIEGSKTVRMDVNNMNTAYYRRKNVIFLNKL